MLHTKGRDVTKGSATSPQISSCSPVLFLSPSEHAEEPAKRQYYQEADTQAVNRGLNSLLAENIDLKAKCGPFDPTKQILWGNNYWKKEKNRKIRGSCHPCGQGLRPLPLPEALTWQLFPGQIQHPGARPSAAGSRERLSPPRSAPRGLLAVISGEHMTRIYPRAAQCAPVCSLKRGPP